MKLGARDIASKSLAIRRSIIKMLEEAGSGHSSGALGLSDIYAALYFNIMRHNPHNPDWDERDYLIVSNGHTAPVLYAAMAEVGYFSKDKLATLRKFGSPLQGHPERTALPGIETTSGPLGSGLSQAAGVAYVLKYFHSSPHRFVYTVLGDGELDEGNIWEAAMFASKYKLGKLITFIDRNSIQIGGGTEDVMPLENLQDKWKSFGWHVQEIDGHNIDSILTSVNIAKAIVDRPSVIIAQTIPGKGVDFMEYDYRWHGMAPNSEQAEVALASLDNQFNSNRGSNS